MSDFKFKIIDDIEDEDFKSKKINKESKPQENKEVDDKKQENIFQ